MPQQPRDHRGTRYQDPGTARIQPKEFNSPVDGQTAHFFQAGLNLVFFDELMKTVPPDQAPTFVSLAQNLRYLSVVIGPLLGTALADRIGLAGGLYVGAAVRFAGFLLFALQGGVIHQLVKKRSL